VYDQMMIDIFLRPLFSLLLCYDAIDALSLWSNDDRHISEASLLSSPLYFVLIIVWCLPVFFEGVAYDPHVYRSWSLLLYYKYYYYYY
jgi:hypothetical protein